MSSYELLEGDALEVLRTLPDESVDCVMTSPPYWALRDYGVDGQLGLEPTFQEYINKLCDIFDEVKRVLKKEGTCWVNIGDTYSGGGSGQKDTGKHNYPSEVMCGTGNKPSSKTELINKNLCNIPSRFSIEMQNRGWILRNEIIWHKPNCMPSSVKDRFTVDFEKIFFFVKSKKYWFETQREPHKEESIKRSARGRKSEKYDKKEYSTSYKTEYIGYEDLKGKLERGELRGTHKDGRNKRTVWTITTKPFKGAHFAVFPPELCETPLKAGCPEFVCKKCGFIKEIKKKPLPVNEGKPLVVNENKPYAVVECEGHIEFRDLPEINLIKDYLNFHRKKLNLTIKDVEEKLESKAPHHWFAGESYPSRNDWLRIKKLLKFDDKYDEFMTKIFLKSGEKLKSEYKDYITTCDCGVGFEGGVVLDPFMGSGTTGVVALQQNKKFIGIELNPEYIKIAKKRIEEKK